MKNTRPPGMIRRRVQKSIVVGLIAIAAFLGIPRALYRVPSPITPPPEPEELPSEESLFDPFPFPEALASRVNFWKKIFTEYTTRQVVIHDDWYLEVIYEVIDLDDPEFKDEKAAWKAARAARRKYEVLLDNMAKQWEQPGKMSTRERELYALFENIPEASRVRRKDAKERVHLQVGQADRVQAGLIRSGMYLETMHQIFTEAGLPEKLVYLPLIESAFNPFAESHAGAAGMWQFMPGTGKQYDLNVTSSIDERKDPLQATRAAARLLAHNYEIIESWPLAITAYNHGLQGMKNAVRKVGSDDIVDILEEYSGSRFGYASRNFYVEFLAAIDVGLRYPLYFGEITLSPPLEIVQFPLPDYVSAPTLAQYTDLTLEDLKTLNPAVKASFFQRGSFLPKNYALNLPAERKAAFEAQYASIPLSQRYQYLAVKARHTIKKGETLSEIAQRYHVSIKAISRLNGIRNPRKIRAGQILKIPGGYVMASADTSSSEGASSNSAPATSSAEGRQHTIQKGQTLIAIAKIYGTSAGAIAEVNTIQDPRRIKAGQVLRIPVQEHRTTQIHDKEHTIRKGQTLVAIAKMYNTSVKALAQHNAITNPRRLKPGQKLRIPEG